MAAGELDVEAVAWLCKCLRVARAEALGPFTATTVSGALAKRKDKDPRNGNGNGAGQQDGQTEGGAEDGGPGGNDAIAVSMEEDAPMSEEAKRGMELRRASSGPRKLNVIGRDVENYKWQQQRYL